MASKITYKYLVYPKKSPTSGKIVGEFARPELPIRLSYGHKLSRPFYALIDSGSDRNLFPAEIAESIGVNVKKGKSAYIAGIGTSMLNAYTHEMLIYINNQPFRVEIDFCYGHGKPLLGRFGFFNLFSAVIFKETERTVEIKFIND